MALCRESAMDLCKEIITTPLQTVNNEIEECSLGGVQQSLSFPSYTQHNFPGPHKVSATN